MSDPVAALEGVGSVAQSNLDLRTNAGDGPSDETRALSFGRVAEEALATTVTRPNAQPRMDDLREEISGGEAGLVGEFRQDIVSNVERPGTAERDPAEGSDALQDEHETRVRSLYMDLSNYQIAWKIAQRIQQDITQLMRG
ncbi:MAG: hypothetical protein WBG95_05210 [Sulfitobacter sp.]